MWFSGLCFMLIYHDWIFLTLNYGAMLKSFIDRCDVSEAFVFVMFINIECISMTCFNMIDGKSFHVVRSNCRGWRWSSARSPRIKKSSRGTS